MLSLNVKPAKRVINSSTFSNQVAKKPRNDVPSTARSKSSEACSSSGTSHKCPFFGPDKRQRVTAKQVSEGADHTFFEYWSARKEAEEPSRPPPTSASERRRAMLERIALRTHGCTEGGGVPSLV